MTKFHYKKVLGAVIASIMVLTGVPGVNTEAKADTDANVETAVELDFSHISGNYISDRSGNGNDAEIGGTLSVEGGALIFDGNGYLNLPVSIMDDLQDEEEFTIETTFSRSSSCGNNAWLFNFGSNPKGTGTNYLFLSPAFGGSTLRGGIKDDSNEKLLDTGMSTVADKEYTAVMVFDKGKVSLYLNGAQIGKTIDSGYSIRKDVINNGCKNNILGYLAKSCWSADQLFQGKVKSFKIMDGAESAESIQKRFSEQFSKDFESSLTIEDILGRNASADRIQFDLTLLSEVNENAVTWKSSDTSVITDDGKVLNDASEDKDVTLTAVCTSGGLKAEQNFALKVLKLDRTELDKLIARTKAVDGYEANEALKNAVSEAEKASTQTEVRNAVKALNTVLKTEQDTLYKDPFSLIDDAMFPAEKEVVVGTEEVLAELSSKILDSVKVAVSSENSDTVEISEEYGVIRVKAVKAGTSDVTVSVTADYDNFTIDYETRVKAVAKNEKIDEKSKTPSAPVNNIVTESDANVVLTGGNTYKINMSYPVKSYKLDKSEKKIIRVSKSGIVKVKKTGTVTLEVVGKNGENHEFTIYAEVPKAVKKTVTSAGSFNASELVKDAEYSKPTGYKSSNEKVAKVSENGIITVLSKGSARITLFYGKRKVNAKIKVKL
ncbi:Ig-like domain (group 2) [Lachnospiraceae bacterium]|nr:Ig-like domain (group 2) [Lachnospiraceae bacterium]